jgi:hypothetical protein
MNRAFNADGFHEFLALPQAAYERRAFGAKTDTLHVL